MNLSGILRTLTAAVLVLGTWGLWAYQSYVGEATDALLFSVVLVMVLAATSVVFGSGALTRALDALVAVREATATDTTPENEESARAESDASGGTGGE